MFLHSFGRFKGWPRVCRGTAITIYELQYLSSIFECYHRFEEQVFGSGVSGVLGTLFQEKGKRTNLQRLVIRKIAISLRGDSWDPTILLRLELLSRKMGNG